MVIFRTFDSQNTATYVKFDFKTFAVCSISIVHFLNNIECDFENFIVVIKCKNYLEKRLLRILLNIFLSSLES